VTGRQFENQAVRRNSSGSIRVLAFSELEKAVERRFLKRIPPGLSKPLNGKKLSLPPGWASESPTAITRSTRFCRTFQCLAVPRQPLKLLETLER
jgi:hypothetical protein